MKRRLALVVATWFGSGLIPPIILRGMAGTYGSVAAIPLCYLALWSSAAMESDPQKQVAFYALVAIIIFWVGIFSVPTAEKVLGPRKDWRGKIRERDQNEIVIDEVLGMLVTCAPLLWVRHNALAFLVAFAAFRLFDIVKPWPARYFDRMKNSMGVMLDDAVAGVYAALALLVFHALF